MALDVHTSEMAGDILVFLTGWLKLLRPGITLFLDSDNVFDVFGLQVSQRLSVPVTCCMKKQSL